MEAELAGYLNVYVIGLEDTEGAALADTSPVHRSQSSVVSPLRRRLP